MLYCYPDSITDALIDVMAREEKIVNYIDLPLQHCNSEILRKMHRRGDRASLTALLNKMREKIPNVIFRSTFITGFPGETEEQFEELAEFAKEMNFQRLGCFAYSEYCESLLDTDIEVLVEGFDRLAECWYGRTYADAPEVDGCVFFTSPQKPQIGSFVTVHITDYLGCDPYGEIID